MKRTNYAAWDINPAEFPTEGTTAEQLRFLIKYAVLAPSSHNTQPWQFTVTDEVLHIAAQPNRALPVSDPDDRQLYLSLGAAIATIENAARGHGYAVEITYTDTGATISLGSKTPPEPELLTTIIARHSNRHPYHDEALPEELVLKLNKSAVGVCNVNFFTDPEKRRMIADATADATRQTFDDPKFRGELSQWVHHNWTAAPDGMPGFVQGIPGPPSLLAPIIMSRFNVGNSQAKKDQGLIAAGPVIAVLTTKDVQKGWLDAGRTFGNLALLIEQAGFDSSAYTAAIEVPDIVQQLQQGLGLTEAPVAIMRLGRAKKVGRHSPRHSADAVTN